IARLLKPTGNVGVFVRGCHVRAVRVTVCSEEAQESGEHFARRRILADSRVKIVAHFVVLGILQGDDIAELCAALPRESIAIYDNSEVSDKGRMCVSHDFSLSLIGYI